MEHLFILLFFVSLSLGAIFDLLLIRLLIKKAISDDLAGAHRCISLISRVCIYMIVIPSAIFATVSIVIYIIQ